MKYQTPTISIVIVTYKRPGLAKSLAQSIRKIHKGIEIMIIDNVPHGNISAARNKGLMSAHTEIVLFLDDDVEITPSTIESHLSRYTDPKVMSVTGRVINDGEEVPRDTNVATGQTDTLGTSFVQQFWSTKEQKIDFPYGCNMSFRRQNLIKVGGFDEHYLRIFDDIDIGYQIKRQGKILFEPSALVYHHKAPSGGTRDTQKNHQKMLYQYYGYYLGKNITFPISILSLMLRTKTILTEAPFAVFNLYNGYIKGLLKILSSHATTAGSNRK